MKNRLWILQLLSGLAAYVERIKVGFDIGCRMAKFSYNGNILGWLSLGHTYCSMAVDQHIYFLILCRYVVDIYILKCWYQQTLSITPLAQTTVNGHCSFVDKYTPHPNSSPCNESMKRWSSYFIQNKISTEILHGKCDAIHMLDITMTVSQDKMHPVGAIFE